MTPFSFRTVHYEKIKRLILAKILEYGLDKPHLTRYIVRVVEARRLFS